MTRNVGYAVFAAAALVLMASGPRGQAVAPTLSKDVQPIFDEGCDCHQGSNARAKLDLTAGKSYASLVNQPSIQVATMMRVKAGDPDASYLMVKLDHKNTVGKGMPKSFFGSTSLSPKDLETIRAWIREGAQP